MAASTKSKLFQEGGAQAVRDGLLRPLCTEAGQRRKKFFALAGSCPDIADVPPHTDQPIPQEKTAPDFSPPIKPLSG